MSDTMTSATSSVTTSLPLSSVSSTECFPPRALSTSSSTSTSKSHLREIQLPAFLLEEPLRLDFRSNPAVSGSHRLGYTAWDLPSLESPYDPQFPPRFFLEFFFTLNGHALSVTRTEMHDAWFNSFNAFHFYDQLYFKITGVVQKTLSPHSAWDEILIEIIKDCRDLHCAILSILRDFFDLLVQVERNSLPPPKAIKDDRDFNSVLLSPAPKTFTFFLRVAKAAADYSLGTEVLTYPSVLKEFYATRWGEEPYLPFSAMKSWYYTWATERAAAAEEKRMQREEKMHRSIRQVLRRSIHPWREFKGLVVKAGQVPQVVKGWLEKPEVVVPLKQPRPYWLDEVPLFTVKPERRGTTSTPSLSSVPLSLPSLVPSRTSTLGSTSTWSTRYNVESTTWG